MTTNDNSCQYRPPGNGLWVKPWYPFCSHQNSRRRFIPPILEFAKQISQIHPNLEIRGFEDSEIINSFYVQNIFFLNDMLKIMGFVLTHPSLHSTSLSVPPHPSDPIAALVDFESMHSCLGRRGVDAGGSTVMVCTYSQTVSTTHILLITLVR